MRKMMMAVAVISSLAGCKAVMQWDAMKMQEKQKHAVYALSEQCDNGNTQACAFIAGQGMRVQEAR